MLDVEYVVVPALIVLIGILIAWISILRVLSLRNRTLPKWRKAQRRHRSFMHRSDRRCSCIQQWVQCNRTPSLPLEAARPDIPGERAQDAHRLHW
jgi:hypothetical protein